MGGDTAQKINYEQGGQQKGVTAPVHANPQKNNLLHNLASWNLPDSQHCLESKTEPSVVKAESYIELHWVGGDNAQKNVY